MSLTPIRFGAVNCVSYEILQNGNQQYRFTLAHQDVDTFSSLSTLNNPLDVKLTLIPNEGLNIERGTEPPRPLHPKELPLVKKLVNESYWMAWKGHEMKNTLMNGLLISAAHYLHVGDTLDKLFAEIGKNTPAPITTPTAV